MTYVDIFVAAVPNENKDKFVHHSKMSYGVFKKYGALKIFDCWADDVSEGEVTSLPKAVKKKEDETVAFSFITWPDKATRDEGMPKIMADPQMQEDVNPLPFDGARCIFGGFEVLGTS